MITYHHIGGRNGTFPVPLKDVSFSKDVHLVLYDADPDCYEQIVQSEKGAFGKVTVYPYCIGEKTTSGFLNINFHPTTSSLYSFNEAYKNYTAVLNPIYGEYQLGEACQLIKSIPIELLSLEDALKKSDAETIDFLSLDVQGAEYDILLGAKALIQKKCLAVQLEVEFAKIYKSQKSFSDINSFMERLGFELIELDRFGRYSPTSTPIGFRGQEQPLYAEAIYIKKFSELEEEKNIERLYKWALFCLINKKIGLCIKSLGLIALLKKNGAFQSNKFQYVLLLDEIWTLFQKERDCKLPNFSELLSQEMLHAFYQGIPNNSDQFCEQRNKIKDFLLNKYAKQLSRVKNLNNEAATPFEHLLKQNGLDSVAEAVRENRLLESKCFLDLINPLLKIT